MVPVVVNPVAGARNMIGVPVEIWGGYPASNNVRRLFKGRIAKCRLRYTSNGRLVATMECYSLGYQLASKKRDYVYPTVARQQDPTQVEGKKVRELSVGDNRDWSVLAHGRAITLETIVRKIAEDYQLTIPEDGIQVPKVSFNGSSRELHQKNKTDWQFLQELARKYGCKMTLDEESEMFYFVQQDALLNEQMVNQEGNTITKKPSFWFNRLSERNPYRIIPLDKFDPTLPDAALPILQCQYDFDASRIIGGMVEQSTDIEGNMHFHATIIDDDGKVGYETLTLRKEKLRGEEARAFMRNYRVGETTWEQTKQFWKSDVVRVQHDPTSRDNPPVNPAANLSFETIGHPDIVPMRRYDVHNLGFGQLADGSDRAELLLVSVTHTLGETYRMSIGMQAF
jgi:hypothetical protein